MVCGKSLVQILASGPTEWNAFRDEHADWVMLNDAALPSAWLVRANLERTFLLRSDLRGANLEGAHLERAILRKCNLHGSNLRNAKFDNADLFDANLGEADLRGASLSCCFLNRVDLRGADLSTAEGLTFAQIVKALGDDYTKLPANVCRPESWVRKGVPA